MHIGKLISTLIIHVLESILSKLAICEISTFLLVSVAEETDFSLVLSENQKYVMYRNSRSDIPQK